MIFAGIMRANADLIFFDYKNQPYEKKESIFTHLKSTYIFALIIYTTYKKSVLKNF